MNQAQLDQLLAWTMLAAIKGTVIERQNAFGRDLTAEEYAQCHKDSYKAAELLRQELELNRELRCT